VGATDRTRPVRDRDLVGVWQRFNRVRFDRILLQTRLGSVEPRSDGLLVRFDGAQAPAEPVLYDAVLVATGRIANGHALGLEHAGVTVDEHGVVPVDSQRRTNVAHIFAIGDLTGSPMLAHKAVHEGHVAAEAVAGEAAHFDARVIPAVAYTDPEIAWVGVTEDAAAEAKTPVRVAKFPWAASGRAIANARDEGLTKLLFEPESGRIVGGGIVGTGAGDLIGEIALAIEMNADAVDLGRTIHPHPTLAESIALAADVGAGTCTDLPPPRARG
jgi:dihydrolipoamide dehydrogenase